MDKLTSKEEEIMQVLWKLKKAFVKEVVAELPKPKPHYNTVSTVIRKMEDKGFVKHEQGRRSRKPRRPGPPIPVLISKFRLLFLGEL